MANIRKRIKTELDLQTKETGEDLSLLYKALEACTTSNEWDALSNVDWVRTGNGAFQSKRRYRPSKLLLKLKETL